MAMTHTVLGVFSDREDVEEAIADLQANGYNPKDISIVMKDQSQGQEIAGSTGANVAEGAVSGATTGAMLGGLAGLLIGIGAIAIPGIGGLLIGGPLVAALGLSGAAATTVSGAATGAVAGGLLGALVGLGVPEEQAQVYESRVREGGILLAVPVDQEHALEVQEALEDYDAEDITTITMRDTKAQYKGHTFSDGTKHRVRGRRNAM